VSLSQGGKLSFWEGGIRVPGIVSGGALPLKQRGSALEGYFHVADVLETLRAIGGATTPAVDPVAAAAGLAPIDSINQWAYITGNTSTAPRTVVPVSSQAYIDGDYKLLVGSQPSAFWQGPQYPNSTTPNNGTGIVPDTIKEDCGSTGCLFDISSDPTEHNNLAASMPAKAATMLQSLQAVIDTISPNPAYRGTPQEEACEAAAAAGGFWVPFVDTEWTAIDAMEWLDFMHDGSSR
jgi:arylsulfatase A-like enzyme